MVPLRLFRCKSLQHNEAHRGECQRTPQKMTRGKIHSQEVQRCELPNFSGNGSMQAVLPQSPTVKKKKIRQISSNDNTQNSPTVGSTMWASQPQWEWFHSGRSDSNTCNQRSPQWMTQKPTTGQNSLTTRLMIWASKSEGMVPLKLFSDNALQQKKPKESQKQPITATSKIHWHIRQSCQPPYLSGNGSTQAILKQPSTAKDALSVNYPKDDKKHNSLTDRSKMTAS